MKPFYSLCSPKHTPHRIITHCLRPLGLLLALLLVSAGAWAHPSAADELQSASIAGEGIDEFGAFVDIYLPVSNKDNVDRWVSSGHLFVNNGSGGRMIGDYWSVSTENRVANFSLRGGGGMRIRSHDGGWSGFMSDGNEHHVGEASGDMARIVVRWYLSQGDLGKSLAFNVETEIDGNSGAGVGYTGSADYGLGSRTVQNPLITATLTAAVAASPGSMKVDFSYSAVIGSTDPNLNNQYTITHWLDDNTAGTVTDPKGVAASGTVTIARQNTPHNAIFRSKFMGAGNHVVYTRDQPVEIPAYQWPAAITPVYNEGTGIVTVSWNINALAASAYYIKGDEFEVERSLDAAFPAASTKKFSVAFDGSTTAYTISDDLKSENVQGTVYYRLRRTDSRANWEWNSKVSASRLVKMNLLGVEVIPSTPVVLDESGASPRVVLRWSVLTGVWPAGSHFIITRTESNGGPLIRTNFQLTDAELKAAKYEDENITSCVNYSYALYVQPGSGAYSAKDSVRLSGLVVLKKIGTVSNLRVSKGYFSDRVELQWYSEGGFSQYLVYRAAAGSAANAVQIAAVPASTAAGTNILYEDTRPAAGTYYTYYVEGVVQCAGVTERTPRLEDVGFRSPTGNIYGRVTFENGQGVENVAVRLQNNNGTLPLKSVLLDGQPGSFLQLDSLVTPFSEQAFSIESWIKPATAAPANQALFSRNGQYEMGFDAAGKLYFSAYGNVVSAAYANPGQIFVHVAGVFRQDSLFLYFNGRKAAAAAVTVPPAGMPGKQVFIGRSSPGNYYSGHIDEVRAWNRALTEDEISRNHARMLSGNEIGLAAYWRLDETVPGRFFDLSKQGEEFNRNDGRMGAGSVIRSMEVPTPEQLALKDFTDQSGNYMVSGIPYTDNGTTYTIIPTLGTHQFDPVTVNRLVSASSNEFTVDFRDKSSFPVSGTIYYRNSTIPVKGVQFTIDGQLAHLQNGEIIETDEAGKFIILVPVGTHEVKAAKLHHGFMNNGLITDRFGRNLNYQAPVSERILYDSTTIRFIGRVAGGAIQDAHDLGHSLSKNNLGEQLSVTMELVGAQNRKINASDAHTDSLVTVNHLLPSHQQTVQRKTNVHYNTYSIVIKPDPVTGEFAADLAPENYNIVSVKATGHEDLVGNTPVNLNLSDKFNVEKSLHTYKDSVTTDGGTFAREYTDTVPYNASYKFIHRQRPEISLAQLDKRGEPVVWLGDTTVNISNFDGSGLAVPVVDKTNGAYLFSYPVFTQHTKYNFKVTAFERYNYFKENNLAIPVSSEQVPTADGLISVSNSLRDGPAEPDTMSLNNEGKAVYIFSAGGPEMGNGIGRKGFSLSVKIGAQVLQWNNGAMQEGYVLGGRKTGTDFVTAGPNELLGILRDPGGSNSSAYYESGTTFTTTKQYQGTAVQSGDIKIKTYLGTTITSVTGIGFALETKTDIHNTIGGIISHEESYTGTDTKTETTTFQTRYTTSNAPGYVGAEGDLFIGNATNISYGNTLNLAVVPNNEVKAGVETVFFDGAAKGVPYSIIQRQGIDFSQHFATHFVYPAKHIENTLIPSLIKGRNEILLPNTVSPATAETRAENLGQPVYLSKLPATDPRYGASNNDASVFGANAAAPGSFDGPSYTVYVPAAPISISDTIHIINQHIASWKKQLSDNEQAKLEASDFKNFSFTGGSNISAVEQTSSSKNHVNSFQITLGGAILSERGFLSNKTGMVVSVDERLSTTQSGSFSNGSSSTTSLGFTLAETGSDYLSVDLQKAKDGSLVFKTKGGVTQCPYEGATRTKYYQPGTVLDQATMQAEVPSINVETPVVKNIPSSRKASYTVKMFNASDIKSSAGFRIRVGDESNPHGARLYMDGTELGTGREIRVPAGDVLSKTITLERGPDTMDYENIFLILESTCQSDIADTVALSAYFIPSCSDIHLKSPLDKWILNAASPVNDEGDHYLPVTIDEFDVNNNLFDHISLQYKPTSSATWVTVMNFYSDTAKYNAAQGEKMKITGNGIINYNFAMNAIALNDQVYDIRAVSYCMSNGQLIATTESNLVSGMKDTYYPRLFGNPQPANGILGLEDDVRINFNEPVADGLLSYTDFQVTGIRNGTPTDHNVSVKLDGVDDYAATEFSRNFSGKDLSIELWALPDAAANGTLFSQGTPAQSLELALTKDNYLEVTVGGKTVRSEAPVQYRNGEWAHIAMVLNAETNKVSAYYNFTEVVPAVTVPAYTGSGIIQAGKSIRTGGNLFAGKMHGLRIWSDVRSSITLQQNSLRELSGSENSLLAYYPMNEGKGQTLLDKSRGVNARLTGNWSLPAGKAVALNGDAYVKLNTAFAPILKEMDFTLELWFKGAPGQSGATLLASGRGDGQDAGGSVNLFWLGFESSALAFRNNGTLITVDGNYLDNSWHHVALAVNRNTGYGQVLVDGQLKKTFDSQGLGGLSAAYAYAGARTWYSEDAPAQPQTDNYFNGVIDEVRIWNTYLDQPLLVKNNNTALKGDEFGLLAYYPFERYFTFQNNQELGYTLGDRKIQEVPSTVVPDAVAEKAAESDETAPVKRAGAVEPLQFNYVVNSDGLIINLLEPRQAIDKTIVTFKARNIRDKNGNTIQSPITWSAYVDRNPLKWSDDELNFSKKVYEALAFEVQIVNHGGSMQNFRLSNLPGWLTASPSSGTLQPKGTQKIVFTVNKGLNIGSYDETVYMQNDHQESEPLAINLHVKGELPDWKVDPAEFKYNMTIYGRVRTQGVFSVNPGDLLAAFVNGRCVGVANNTHYPTTGNWYSLLTVYSDSLKEGGLEFRIWDAATGKTFLATPSRPISFVNDSILGTPREPVIFDGSEMQFRDIRLNRGWNWISFGLTGNTLGRVPSALANGQWASGDLVKNDELGFDSYSSSSGWVGTLGGFNNTSLFMLNTANEQTLSISGTQPDLSKTSIAVKGGRWNYISYLPPVNMSVTEALAGYEASEQDVIKSQTAFAMYDTRNGWVGNLSYLEPGKGYMLYRKTPASTSFVYPTISGIMTDLGRLANNLQSAVDNNYRYAENMTVVAETGGDFSLLPGDKVLAYVNGELRGEAVSMANPVTRRQSYFINIAGNAEQSVRFAATRNGRAIGSAEQMPGYLSDSYLGTVQEPYVLKFSSENTADGADIYPNPFHEQVRIRVNLGNVQKATLQMSVFDLSGKPVYTAAPVSTGGVYHDLYWNGKDLAGNSCAPGVYLVTVHLNGKKKVYKVVKI